MMNWTPYLAVWSFFASIVLVLAIYRKMLSAREDDSIHVSASSAGLLSQQAVNTQRIQVVERWGKLLTTVVVAAGLAMASVYFYAIFQTSATTVAVQ